MSNMKGVPAAEGIGTLELESDDAGDLAGWPVDGAPPAPPAPVELAAPAAPPVVEDDEDDEDLDLLAAMAGVPRPLTSLPTRDGMDEQGILVQLEVDGLSARAGQLLQLAGAMQRRLDRIEQRQSADIDRIVEFYRHRRARDEATLGWVERELEEVAKLLRPHFPNKAKTWKTPWGNLTFRKVGGGYSVEDRDAFIEWARENIPELVRAEVETTYKVETKVAIPAALEKLQGEMPPGVVDRPASERFSFEVTR